MSWRPILEGELASRARDAIVDVARALERSESGADPTLGNGDAGVALLFAYLERTGVCPSGGETRRRFLDAAIDYLATEQVGPSLYGGFAGVAWVAEHLREEDDDDPNEDIDVAVRQGLEALGREFDLIGGLCGLGVYAIERLARARSTTLLGEVVSALAEIAVREGDTVTWHCDPALLVPETRAEHPAGYYNLGVAHGVPAVIAVLAHAVAVDADGETARWLLDGATRWLLAQRLESGPSRYPWISGARDSRSAWCYGDPGIAMCLRVAGRASGDARLEREAEETMRAALDRDPAGAGVTDAPLCHGAAGLAHLFNRYHQATGDAGARVAATWWFERTLDMRRPPGRFGGFSSSQGDATGTISLVEHRGFLSGCAGVALALLAGTTVVEPSWDRVLLAGW